MTVMPAKTYRFRYSADNKDLEVEGDRAFVMAMIKRFLPDAAGAAPLVIRQAKGKTDKKVPLPEQPITKDVSLREFIQRLGPKKHTDIVLAFGYFLEKYRGNQNFTAADIKSCYYESKLESSNTSQMIIYNIRTGRMMEAKKAEKAEKRRRYTLTRSGEEYIAERLAPVS
jgi:hypothetical protein